jgi:hypothetical protein
VLGGIAGARIAPLDVVPEIEARLMAFISALRAGSIAATPAADVQQYSRQHAAGQLADLLNVVCSREAVR